MVVAAMQPRPAMVPCKKCPLRDNRRLRDFTPEELDFVWNFKTGELHADVGTSLLMQGANSAHLYTVLSGWAFRYKVLADGRRQILNFALPGDLLGLQGSITDEMEHSVEALTEMVLCVFSRDRLWELYSKYPSLAFDVTWLAAREEQMLDEHLLNVGRRSAIERTAHLLLHLFLRAEELDLTKGRSVVFPFTQQHVADALGMSLVHTNKTLRRLTTMKTIRWRPGAFEILDRERLIEIAGFEVPERRQRPFV